MFGVSEGLRVGKGPRTELSIDKAARSPPLLCIVPQKGLQHQALLRPQLNQWDDARPASSSNSWSLKESNSNSY